jgi:serine/threonine protein phosphatase PrpC
MSQSGTKQPARISGQIIIDELVRNMELGCLELGYSILLPCIFSVYLHPDDYNRLIGVQDIIKEDARRALTARMAEWNKKGALFKRGNTTRKEYRIAQSTWVIDFFCDGENAVPPADVEIHSELNDVAQPGYRGAKTTLIERQPSVTAARVARDREGTRRNFPGRPAEAGRIYGEIHYSDDSGPQTYFITQNEISVGRGGEGMWTWRSTRTTRSRANICASAATRRPAHSSSPIRAATARGSTDAACPMAPRPRFQTAPKSVWLRPSRSTSRRANEAALQSAHPVRHRVSSVRGDLRGSPCARGPVMIPLAGAATDTGLLREQNEDRYWMDVERGLFLVVDGVGGRSAGELAAQTAVETIREAMCWTGASAEERVKAAITAANNRIFRRAQKDEEYRGMACVLTLALVEEGRITIGHVGDSRLYLVWDGAIRKLTSDHSPVGEDEDAGELTEQEAMVHPRRNEVFRDVGSRLRDVDERGFIEIRECRFREDAALLLCSDGLTDHLTAEQIRAITGRYDGDPGRTAADLVEAANEAGGRDNITALFVAGPRFRGRVDATRPRFTGTTATAERPRSLARRLGGRLAFLTYGLLIGMLLWMVLRK